MTLKNNRNGSNYDHDDGDDDEKNENDVHCCHFLDSCCIKFFFYCFLAPFTDLKKWKRRGMRGS